MSNKVIVLPKDNLLVYPEKDQERLGDSNNQLTIGDLHGNALRLVNFLIRQNALEMSKEDYERFVKIYIKPAKRLTKNDLILFQQILNRSKIDSSKVKTIRLIGDELCDRGSNDYFTLKVFEKIGKSGVHLETLISNHGAGFLTAYGKWKKFKNAMAQVGRKITTTRWASAANVFPNTSLEGLAELLANGLVEEKEVERLVENFYKPNIKALSYTVDKTLPIPKITIYTHAPAGLETIKAASTSYFDMNIDQLCKTIDSINLMYSQDIRNNDPHFRHAASRPDTDVNVPLKTPFYRLMWNRCAHYIETEGRVEVDKKAVQAIDLPTIKHSGAIIPPNCVPFEIELVHGHVGPSPFVINKEVKSLEDYFESYKTNMINLDTDQGKDDPEIPIEFAMRGTYLALHSHQTPAKNLNKIVEEYKQYGIELGEIILQDLPEYIADRKAETGKKKDTNQSEEQYLNSLANSFNSFWGRFTKMNAAVKIQAAAKLIKLVKLEHSTQNNQEPVKFTKEELLALRDGRLGKITAKLEAIPSFSEILTPEVNNRCILAS